MLLLLTSLTPAAAVEWCNGLDDDGDGRVDEGPVVVGPDDDGDGYAASARLAPACEPWDLPAGDCEDGQPSRLPDPDNEACNGTDGNCDGVVDDQTCPCPIVTVGGRAFQVCSNLETWADADAACAVAAPWHLASLGSSGSQSDAEVVIAQFPYSPPFWIGFNDRTTEGVFAWSDGSDPTYTNWRYGEPNDGTCTGCSEDCAEIESGGYWDDQSCDDRQPYLCEAACTVYDWYPDRDGDGLGDPSTSPESECTRPEDHVLEAFDCDDGDPNLPAVGYGDEDGDGVGTEELRVGCGRLAADGDDCDDLDDRRTPRVPEVACNGIDDDCDDETGDVADDDGDGVDSCADCDDHDPDVFPGAPDDPTDGVDTDCDGAPETLDRDGDGLPDLDELPGDSDGDGVADIDDPDSDDDGALDGADPRPYDPGGSLGDDPAADYGLGFGCAVAPRPSAFALLALLALRRSRRP